MKFLCALLVLLITSSSAMAGDLTCDQIRQGFSWNFDFSKVPQQIESNSNLIIPGTVRVTDSRLLENAFSYFDVSSRFLSEAVTAFAVPAMQFFDDSTVIVGQDIPASLYFNFHGGTAGRFALKDLTVEFVNKNYGATTCSFPVSPIVLSVRNVGEVADMAPPKVSGAELIGSSESRNWRLNLELKDDSEISLYEPGDDAVAHFIFLNVDTGASVHCFNRNLRHDPSAGANGFYVDLFVSRPSDTLITIPAGKYQLVGFNRSDAFGNFAFEIGDKLVVKAESPFYCRR